MARPTKSSIERALLVGDATQFVEANGKTSEITLRTPSARRIFDFIRLSSVRDAKDLPLSFVEGLWGAYSEGDDPAIRLQSREDGPSLQQRIWRIFEVQTHNFGGLNIWGGPEFKWLLKADSWLLDGENGSGKSSLLGAIVWACTGIRPRDETSAPPHIDAPVLDSRHEKVGTWPPLACYPSDAAEIAKSPDVEVRVTFVDELSGEMAVVTRALRAGKLHESWDPIFDVRDVFISTGIAMPVALPSLRLKDKEGEGALTRAVTQLTGLDEFEAIGELCSGLGNGGREYASYAKKAGLSLKESNFQEKLDQAAKELAQIGEKLPSFRPADALEKTGPMIELGVRVKNAAVEYASTLSSDLAEDCDAISTDGQKAIIVALNAATSKLAEGLQGIPFWKSLTELAAALTPTIAASIQTSLETAREELKEAIRNHGQQQSDTRYRLKATAADWHAKHSQGDILECPLCVQRLDALPELQKELQGLTAAGALAQLNLQQSITQIRESLLGNISKTVQVFMGEVRFNEPRQTLCESIRAALGSGAKHGRLLAGLSLLTDEALQAAPPVELAPMVFDPEECSSKEHEALVSLFQRLEWCFALEKWHVATRQSWETWYSMINAPSPTEQSQVDAGDPSANSKKESVCQHLERLSHAMDSAKPYALAADHLRDAVKLGREIVGIREEQERRSKVIEAMQPLKLLTALSQAIAKQAIEDLSGRIKRILADMHVTERFRYQNATLQKKEGLIVRGSFAGGLHVDATLIANTSWLRSALWAFVFALREEAVEQYGEDPLPVWLFDDPQNTFDLAHRFNWASHVAGMQKAKPAAQIVVATHDETFAARLRQSELQAREGLIKVASPDSGPAAVLEGSSVERYWKMASENRSSTKAAIDYLSDARVYLEGMLKAMLAGQGKNIQAVAVSELRTRMVELGRQGHSPWNKQSFHELAGDLSKPEIAYLNESHHTTRSQLTFSEAKAVNSIWPQLFKRLNQCFRDIRDYRLLHGMPSAFHLSEPEVDFPEGYSDVIKRKVFKLLGKASAFSGTVSEGTLTYESFDGPEQRGVRLAQHSAYRLTASTLEPMARPGDILLVHDSHRPESRSLVVAVAEHKTLARRFVISDAASDVVVLTANALDPFQIASPVVARRESIKLQRIVGVLFDHARSFIPIVDSEIVACAGEAEVNVLLARCTGLVEVSGQSAQPLALDGQYILVGSQVGGADLSRLDGLPVIAMDSDQRRYFKRLRLPGEGLVILESLDGGGDFPPEVMWEPGRQGKRKIEQVWEVLGVLFEYPGE